MSGGIVFANAQISMRAEKLLTRKRIREMASAPDRDGVLSVLAECGYQTDFADDDLLVETERQKTLTTFLELCEDTALASNVQALHDLTEANVVQTFDAIANNTPKIKNNTLQQYFHTLVDWYNVRNHQKGVTTMLPGGNLGAHELPNDPEPIAEQLRTLSAVDKDNIFQLNPLFWWYQQKQAELAIIKTILVSKRFNYDAVFLRENLRGLYEQF